MDSSSANPQGPFEARSVGERFECLEGVDTARRPARLVDSSIAVGMMALKLEWVWRVL